LAELGRAQWGRGQYPAANATLERALAAAAAVDDAGLLSEVSMRLGETAFSLGRYEAALTRYAQAEQFNRRSPAPAREALIQTNVGVALRFLGRYEEAAATTESALRIFRALGNEAGASQALTFLGIINRARAEYQRAIDAYAEAIAIRDKLGDRRGQAQVLGNLGNVFLDLGEYERAVDAYTRSLAIAEAVGYAAQVAFSRANLGAVLGELGRTAAALTRSEEALAAWRQLDRQPEIGRTLRVIAMRHLYGTGDHQKARTALGEALAIARRIKDADLEAFVLLDLAALEHAAGAKAAANDGYQQASDVIAKLNSPDLRYQLLGQRGRTRLQDGDLDLAIADLTASAAIINDIRAGVGSDEAKIALLDTRQAVFQDLAIALSRQGRIVEALEAAEGARARAFADALESRGPRASSGGAVSVDSPRAGEIRAAATRAGATILEYLVTPEALLAWVITPDGEITLTQTAVRADRINELVRALLEELDAPAAPVSDAAVARARLRELHALAIAPVSKRLPQAAASPIIIVPYGALAQVPFAALEDAGGVPLVARHRLSVAPSVSMFRYTSRAGRAAAPRSAVIFAGAQVPPDSGLADIAGSLDEAQRVSAQLAKYAPTLLTGARASESAAKTATRGAAYLHFATHGLVSETRSLNSSLVLTGGGGQDGYLRAREVYALEVSADLVVLSGCSTARGRFTGDGVFGLPRAFLYAGAASVVASLWDISDRATVFFMERFYAELLRTSDKAGALRAAQMATRQRYPHPALWAPFILIGEPR
jgi:CHAT domain-containing protein